MPRFVSSKLKVAAISVFLCSVTFPLMLKAQETKQGKPDDLIRVNTEIVQTDVLVLDKDGQFVAGLMAEQFELRVNGRTRAISFFDRVVAGSATEEEKLSAARGRAPAAANIPKVAFDRGRSIFFYLDDYHLSSDSVKRTRNFLSKFVDTELMPEDEMGIITATGQLGFLEQLTNEAAVLHRAIAKLGNRSFQSGDAERPPMSESEAAAIMQDDRRTLDYFVEQLLKDLGQPRPRQPSTRTRSRSQFESAVKARAKSITDQSVALTVGTLTGLERLIRLSGTLPWRKTMFFISDGFFIHERSNPALDLGRITDAAAHASMVIYSIDARGLSTGVPPANRKMAFDNTGRLVSVNMGSITSSQEALQTLAVNSAGKAILNSNMPENEIKNALKETSNYYLLSWRPDEKDIQDKAYQLVEVKVVGRPDLTVRVRHGFSRSPLGPQARTQKKDAAGGKKKDEEKPLPAALHSLIRKIELPVSLSAGYTDVGESNMLVTSTIEVPVDSLQLSSISPNETSELDLMGAVVDEHGKPLTVFDQNLTIHPGDLKLANSHSVIYNHQLSLPSGLYQLRVALAEPKTGRIGSAMQWIEIPDLKNRPFSMSSLFLGSVDNGAFQSGKLTINAAHRFRSVSRLGFFMYIYNAARNASGCDLALQVQVLRDEEPVITKPLISVEVGQMTDLSRISYGEDLSLEDLPSGQYVLQITVIDRLTKQSAQQRSRFAVY